MKTLLLNGALAMAAAFALTVSGTDVLAKDGSSVESTRPHKGPGYGSYHGGYHKSFSYHGHSYKHYCYPSSYKSWSKYCYFPSYKCYGYYCPSQCCWYCYYPQYTCYMPCTYLTTCAPTPCYSVCPTPCCSYAPTGYNVNQNQNQNTNVNTNININGLPAGAQPISQGMVPPGPGGPQG